MSKQTVTTHGIVSVIQGQEQIRRKLCDVKTMDVPIFAFLTSRRVNGRSDTEEDTVMV